MASPQLSNVNQLMTPDAIVIYPSRGKMLLLTLGAAAFVALGVFILKTASSDDRWIGIASIVFFGLCFGIGVSKLARRTPALIIHSSGLLDNGSALSAGFLPWNEIESIFVSSIRNQRFLAIRVRDEEAMLSRQSGLKAKLMKLNVSLAGAAINIPLTTLPMSLEELIQKIR